MQSQFYKILTLMIFINISDSIVTEFNQISNTNQVIILNWTQFMTYGEIKLLAIDIR